MAAAAAAAAAAAGGAAARRGAFKPEALLSVSYSRLRPCSAAEPSVGAHVFSFRGAGRGTKPFKEKKERAFALSNSLEHKVEREESIGEDVFSLYRLTHTFFIGLIPCAGLRLRLLSSTIASLCPPLLRAASAKWRGSWGG